MKRALLALLCSCWASTAFAQRDMVDISNAVVHNSPTDIASWTRTTRITQLTMRPPNDPYEGISLRFSANATWPDYTPPGWDGPIQYTVWAGINLNGVWHISGIIQMWRDRWSTGAPLLSYGPGCAVNNFACNWVYDGRWGAMAGYQPHVGEAMIFFVSAGNARGIGTVTSVRERSNVVLVNLPAGDNGVFNFPGMDPTPDFNGDGYADLAFRNTVTGDAQVWYLNNSGSMIGSLTLPRVSDVAWRMAATADFNGDGKPDILWRRSTGENLIWFMNLNSIGASANLPAVGRDWQLAVVGDTNGDGFADIVWRHVKLGYNLIWFIGSGGAVISSGLLPNQTDPNWQLQAAGDFSGDGKADVVWRNLATGAVLLWYVSGATVYNSVALPMTSDQTWQIAQATDFNNDGFADLLWRNTLSGALQIWFMNGAGLASQVNLPATGQAWRPAGAPDRPAWRDFNGDGRADIVWRDSSTGSNVIWHMNGGAQLGTTSLPTVADTAWKLAALGDLNNDGNADLVWRNSNTGMNIVWYLSGNSVLSYGDLPAVPSSAWQIAGVADMNNDGYNDIIWRNGTAGSNIVWVMRGHTLLGSLTLPTVADANWSIAGVADMNGDGWPDLLWRNSATGTNQVWFMVGTSIGGGGDLPSVLDQNWQLAQAIDMNGDGYADLVARNQSTGGNMVIYLSGLSVLGTQTITNLGTNWVVAR
jgi:FG-GAP-like repeat